MSRRPSSRLSRRRSRRSTGAYAVAVAFFVVACGPTPNDATDADVDASALDGSPEPPLDGSAGAAGNDSGTAGSAGGGGTGGLAGTGGTGGAAIDLDGSADAMDDAEGGASGAGGSAGAVDGSDGVAGAGGEVAIDEPDGAAGAPPTCGDALRDPLSEECDDGTASTPPDSCAADCHVTDVLPLPGTPLEGGPYPPSRYLGDGRHPVAAGDAGFAVAFVEPGPLPPAIALTTLGPTGIPTGSSRAFGTGSTPVLASNPVLAALPGGLYAAAWTDFDGDGDELGVALRIVDPSVAPSGAPAHANATTAFSQYDPDVVWTGSELVVAWVDGADASTGPDVKYRRFSASLAPLTGELPLATTADAESNVALAPFAGSWAVAWRADTMGEESLFAKAGSVTWHLGPFAPGPTDDRPALAELDATHLSLVYTEGADPADTGVASSSKLRAAILDAGAPGAVTSFGIDPVDVAFAGLAQTHPNVVSTGDRLYVAWRTEARLGDPLGEELWLRDVAWSGSALVWGPREIALPRSDGHRPGDQRHPALAATSLAPSGALATAWDDLGRVFGPSEGNGDVVVELIPSPIVRLDP